jgi:hypothetical protein
MFRAVLFMQWKLTRWPLLAGALISFALPVLSVQRAGLATGAEQNRFSTSLMLSTVEMWSTGYPILATLLALTVALTAWAPDEKGRHVYALSLPLPRWHYALLRLGAGALMLVAPVVSLAAGAMVAVAASTLPAGTQAYPLAVVARFTLATAVVYTLFFTMGGGGDRLGRYLAIALASLLVLHLLFALFGLGDVIGWVSGLLIYWPGPFEIFTGRWMLIDV